jgi:hypothetical protein
VFFCSSPATIAANHADCSLKSVKFWDNFVNNVRKGGPLSRPNRVLPTGEIVADAARGTLTGNRGILVSPDGMMMRRQWAAKAWITCVLDFRGRRRPIAQPHTWTELFFLDEATAFAAGHRPCAYCRRADYNRFKAAFPGAPLATEMDRVLHAERLEDRAKRRHTDLLENLPDGTFVEVGSIPHLVWGDTLIPYAPAKYGAAIAKPQGAVAVLTPPSLIKTLIAGYRVEVRSSARV